MNNNDSNESTVTSEVIGYVEAIDTLLNIEQKYELVQRLNRQLPEHLQMMETGVALRQDDFLNAITGASRQLSRIMLSSGFNPWLLNQNRISGVELNADQTRMYEAIDRIANVSNFNDFVEIYEKIASYAIAYRHAFFEYEKTLNDLVKENDNNR